VMPCLSAITSSNWQSLMSKTLSAFSNSSVRSVSMTVMSASAEVGGVQDSWTQMHMRSGFWQYMRHGKRRQLQIGTHTTMAEGVGSTCTVQTKNMGAQSVDAARTWLLSSRCV
jgi:hypothetical protein